MSELTELNNLLLDKYGYDTATCEITEKEDGFTAYLNTKENFRVDVYESNYYSGYMYAGSGSTRDECLMELKKFISRIPPQEEREAITLIRRMKKMKESMKGMKSKFAETFVEALTKSADEFKNQLPDMRSEMFDLTTKDIEVPF